MHKQTMANSKSTQKKTHERIACFKGILLVERRKIKIKSTAITKPASLCLSGGTPRHKGLQGLCSTMEPFKGWEFGEKKKVEIGYWCAPPPSLKHWQTSGGVLGSPKSSNWMNRQAVTLGDMEALLLMLAWGCLVEIATRGQDGGSTWYAVQQTTLTECRGGMLWSRKKKSWLV